MHQKLGTISHQKHEGLVLRSIDFFDRQKILTLFTPTMGVVSLIVKGITCKKTHLLTLASPLTCGEYLFGTRRSTLYPLYDGTPIKTHSALRNNLNHIEAATLLSRALLKSQMPEKPAPQLYALTLIYLDLIPLFEDPSSPTTSFLLKLLKHEGLLSLDHPPVGFSADEWETACTLTTLRTIRAIKETPTPPPLRKKVEKLFTLQYGASPSGCDA